MAPPEVISTLLSSRKITERLCNYRNAEIGLSLEGSRLGTEIGEITLINIIDPSEKVYVFDVYTNPGLVHEGGLADLLRCENITKVVHDCQTICSMLYWRHGIIVRNVFDVQVAHGLVSNKLAETRSTRGEIYSDKYQHYGSSSDHCQAEITLLSDQFQSDVISSDLCHSGEISSDQFQSMKISSDQSESDVILSDLCCTGDISSKLFESGHILSEKCLSDEISSDQNQTSGSVTDHPIFPVTLKDQLSSSGLSTSRSTSSGVSISRSPEENTSRDKSPLSSPPREQSSVKVPLKSLKDICEIGEVKFSPSWIIKHRGESSKYFWRTRPLTPAMLEYLVETVSALPTLCSSLKRCLSDDSLPTIQQISQGRVLSKVGKTVPA